MRIRKFVEILQNGDDDMLLEFKTKNYKSFSEEADLVMTAAPKQKGLDYSLCRERIKGKDIRGLSTSVLYGPDSSW